jgi:glycosyltransferase involved in cell wall biosynthesis
MYLGYRGKTILFLSEVVCQNADIELMLLPEDLAGVPGDILMSDYEVWNGRPVLKAAPKPPQDLRVALVGVYRIQCGISTYCESLFPEIGSGVRDYQVFAEDAEDAAELPNVTRCWRRGQPLQRLVDQLIQYNPDVILIEHEYGLFPDARHWLAMMGQLQRFRTIVKLHSTYRHHPDKVICEAACNEIVVHTQEAAQVLAAKGLKARIHCIPHGSSPCVSRERFWNRYGSDHTLVQFGFGFHYKGWEQSLRAVAQLRQRYPDIFYTGLFSESPFSQVFHARYHQELEILIRQLGISEHVALIRGFQSDASIDSFLRTNQVAIFPYIDNGVHTVYGCSGAARVAMGAALPVVVSNVPLFADLEGVCPRVGTVDELCGAVEVLFSEPERRAQQVDRQARFLDETSWRAVAAQHLEVFGSVPP